MARLRGQAPPPAPAALPPSLPDHLADWFFDDWVSDDEPVTPIYFVGRPWPPSPAEVVFARHVLSRNRLRAARREWVEQQQARGVKVPAMPPLGKPRRRRPVDDRAG